MAALRAMRAAFAASLRAWLSAFAASLRAWLSALSASLRAWLAALAAAVAASASALTRASLLARALGVLTSDDEDAALGVGRGFLVVSAASGATFLLTGSLDSPGSRSICRRAIAACAALAFRSVPVVVGCCGAGGGPTIGPCCVTGAVPGGGGPGGWPPGGAVAVTWSGSDCRGRIWIAIGAVGGGGGPGDGPRRL